MFHILPRATSYSVCYTDPVCIHKLPTAASLYLCGSCTHVMQYVHVHPIPVTILNRLPSHPISHSVN